MKSFSDSIALFSSSSFSISWIKFLKCILSSSCSSNSSLYDVHMMLIGDHKLDLVDKLS